MTAKLITNEAVHPDLINNYNTFHNHYSEEDLLDFKGKWEDDSDYSNYRMLEDLLENITPEDYEKSHVVSVDIKDIYSSEETLTGGDRPLWSITDNSAIAKQHQNLNKKGGYNMGSGQVLAGMLRPHPTLIDHWQLVKYIGNNRVAMKLLANCGESTRVIMNVQFHDVSQAHDYTYYRKIESELHSTDAGDRSGQSEKQKFMSGFRADYDHQVYAFNFLKKHEYNYGTVMQQEGIEGSENWLTLKSLQGIKDGQGNNHFKTYGEENVGRALQTIKRLCKITGETVIGATPIEAIALMYHVYTEHGKRKENSEPLFSPMELDEFFVKYFKHKNMEGLFTSDKLMVNDLSWSGGVKDIAYICGKQFWPLIVEDWKRLRKTKIGFSIDCHANLRLVDLCKDKNLKRELKAILA